MSKNKFDEVCKDCRIVGVSRIDIVDFNHGVLELITTQLFHSFKYMRLLNLSHNSLGSSGSDFREAFLYMSRLEDINLSNNQLNKHSSVARV